jgi:hypothetical protein
LPLFGVIKVKTFNLIYADDTWEVAITAAYGGGASQSMTVPNDVITAASLKITKVSFLGKLTVSSAEVSYAQEAPNSACSLVIADEIWCGDWKVLVPVRLRRPRRHPQRAEHT